MAEQRNDIRKKANTYFFLKVAINAFLIILGALLITFFLRKMQNETALSKQRISSEQSLKEAISILEANASDAEELTRIYHKGNQDTLDDLIELFKSGVFDSLSKSSTRTRSEVFADIVERSGVDYLFAISDTGKVLISPRSDYYNTNLVELGLLSRENLNALTKGTRNASGSVSPVLEDNQYGYCYFYSVRYMYEGMVFPIVLGVDASKLDLQINSLKDVSAVLRRAAVGNDGFLFAVDLRNNSFLFYQNGSEVMTGKNALEAGLSESALKDGYSGIETINGNRYFCVSRTYGDSTVVCAVAEADHIYANDKYVLFWSITGFVLVMLLCLLYAVIVRNDFVRNAVETDKKVIASGKKNSIIFDKSIFKKVFPLMTAGILVIFGISFYTQTLLEISEGIDNSSVALQDIRARYEESIENRELIRSYYGSRILSKAKLISYLLEEDPSVLNTPTNRWYTEYDASGNKHYLTDDEGNRLKSVAYSTRLQELCDQNDIASIYVFDEDGHTIATNTKNWFFTVSHSSEDQSYEFLQVLDGKLDSLIQEPQINDLGAQGQYIGVSMHYYTTTDKNGNTQYVSRRSYLAALNTARNNITEHHSMLQIELDTKLTEKLLASTEIGYVMSTDLLSGGFVVLFDDTEAHTCLYSPNEASIGKTAKELGISDKAFGSSDYYGFSRVNGTQYFQFFRYEQGYYISMMIPRSEMYQSRTVISLITALTSFILILILSGTVTFTTKEEEFLYATMSETHAKGGLDSAIFNVILPSGKQTSTMKASARWDNRRIRWRDKSPEQKLLLLLSLAGAILVLYVISATLGAKVFFDDGSIIRYILSGNWDRGVNIFALSACALVLIFVTLAVTLFRIPVRLITSLLGTRSETIGHLLLSVLKYGGALGAIFYCLYLIGLDSTSLLASAGVLSLVIGLGAQSLIKDIIAGIFIVFEGEFRVGDIVTINDYRGTVMDIGLRTTKILGMDGNIKIYNNSEITGVLNMTKEASLAFCKISIEYGQDIDYVEAVLKRDLPILKELNPAILEGPAYYGISSLGDSGVELLICCKCSEADIKGVIRFMNKEVLQIFYRNGINVPFPNVTVSRLDANNRKTMADYRNEDEWVSKWKASTVIRSEPVSIKKDGQGIEEALQLTDRVGAKQGLDKKSSLRLHLLTEELFGMLRGITGETEATYWIENKKKNFELHTRSTLLMTKEMRERLLSISTSGKNEASTGFMGQLRDMIAAKLLPSAQSVSGLSNGVIEDSWSESTEDGASEWSMSKYKSDIETRRKQNAGAEEVWDELEKSIVAKLSDEIKIAMKGSDVEITIFKSFSDAD